MDLDTVVVTRHYPTVLVVQSGKRVLEYLHRPCPTCVPLPVDLCLTVTLLKTLKVVLLRIFLGTSSVVSSAPTPFLSRVQYVFYVDDPVPLS